MVQTLVTIWYELTVGHGMTIPRNWDLGAVVDSGCSLSSTYNTGLYDQEKLITMIKMLGHQIDTKLEKIIKQLDEVLEWWKIIV